jgi:iron complex transport system substrate-binding protein
VLRLLALTSVALAPTWASASDLPRVVSVNACTDQLVMMLADPEQVISLSALYDDPRASVMTDTAGRFTKNNGQAESIAVENPDVVVANVYDDPSLIGLLRAVGIEVIQFPVTTALTDIPAEIRRMGKILSQEARASEIATRLEQEIEAIPALGEDAPLAAFFFPNGYALGAGTLSHDILTAAGVRNLSVQLGFKGNGTLSLEQVILNQPDLLIGSRPFDGHSLSEDIATHPALSSFPTLNTSVDWVCGTPFVMRAVADVRDRINALGSD